VQINPFYFAERHSAEQGYTSIARIVQADLFFKVQPPLAWLRLDAARDSGADVDVGDTQFIRQPRCHMLTTGTACLFVRFLQC
jgi:hypothetical protein